MNNALPPSTTGVDDREDATINGPMARFVASLATDDYISPLTSSLPLLDIWGALHRLVGDGQSFEDAVLLATCIRDGLSANRALNPTGRLVAGAFAALHAELLAEGIPAPFAQPFMVGLVWADLSALTGEEPPATVLALLGDPSAA